MKKKSKLANGILRNMRLGRSVSNEEQGVIEKMSDKKLRALQWSLVGVKSGQKLVTGNWTKSTKGAFMRDGKHWFKHPETGKEYCLEGTSMERTRAGIKSNRKPIAFGVDVLHYFPIPSQPGKAYLAVNPEIVDMPVRDPKLRLWEKVTLIEKLKR